MTDTTPSAFSQGGSVKRKSRPRSAKAAAIYAHTIADELLALYQETIGPYVMATAAEREDSVDLWNATEDDLFAVVNALRYLRHEVENP